MESFIPSEGYSLVQKVEEASHETRSSGLLIPTKDAQNTTTLFEVIVSDAYEKDVVVVTSPSTQPLPLTLNENKYYILDNKSILGRIVKS